MNEKEQWIINNIPPHGTDILDSEFVDAFIERFHPPFRPVNWGAHKCSTLGRLLSSMYKKGILDRSRISLGITWQPGWPKWVYAYSVNKYYEGYEGINHE